MAREDSAAAVEPPPLPSLPAPPAVEISAPASSSSLTSLSAGLISAVVHLTVVVTLAVFAVSPKVAQVLGCLEVGVPEQSRAIAELPEATFAAPLPQASKMDDVETLASTPLASVSLLTLDAPTTSELADL